MMKYLSKLIIFFVSTIALILLLHQPTIVLATDNLTIQALEQQAEQLYQQNQYPEAIATLRKAIKEYQEQGDQVGRVLATRNLALIYQKLGQWEQANKTLREAEKITNTIDSELERSKLLAQILEVKGQIELSLGRSQEALETWQQATSLYEEQGNIRGLTQGKIYQATALQSLGLYSQSLKTLTQIESQLQEEPDSLMKAQALLQLGNVFNRVGSYKFAQKSLKSALTTAEKIDHLPIMADIYLSLGNNAKLREQPEIAIGYYQQAIAVAPQADIKLRSELQELEVLISLENRRAASNLAREIEQLIDQLPPGQTSIQGQISLARYLINLDSEPKQIANLLVSAIKQAQKLNITKTEADALGVLGHLYEQHHQWQSAKVITAKALVKAQSVNARELTYQWQWQLGRIYQELGNTEKAIAVYSQATENLQSLRSDFVAISSELQYTFREQIEPVYRQLAILLLSQAKPSQADLIQARNTIEALQVAELDNFFRDACLDAQPKQIDLLDPTAAVIYTIILGDRLEVIAALPDQPLRHYSQDLPPSEIELVLTSAQSQLIEPRRLNLRLFQQAYDWLIRPLEDELKANQIKTLVFVPDGILRNIPPAALYDGQHYLIENYSIAIAPSLQLTELQTRDKERQGVLLAGLSEATQGFTDLPGVQQEIQQIEPLFASNVLLNDNFTELNFNRFASQNPVRIVHLATHGQFSSNAEETFVLTWDNQININELNSLLRGDSKQLRPIELLVLSACDTATGDRLAALGLAGIAVRAGARSTVASLWPVSDQATVVLMTNFYKFLADGSMSKAEALRQAQIATLKHDGYSHPFYWSAFILIGNWL